MPFSPPCMTIWPFLNSMCCIVLHKSRRCVLVMYLKKWMPLLNFVICSICSSVRSSGEDSRAAWHLCHALEAPVFSTNSHKSALSRLYIVSRQGLTLQKFCCALDGATSITFGSPRTKRSDVSMWLRANVVMSTSLAIWMQVCSI
jgi:hypothetical protein